MQRREFDEIVTRFGTDLPFLPIKKGMIKARVHMFDNRAYPASSRTIAAFSYSSLLHPHRLLALGGNLIEDLRRS